MMQIQRMIRSIEVTTGSPSSTPLGLSPERAGVYKVKSPARDSNSSDDSSLLLQSSSCEPSPQSSPYHSTSWSSTASNSSSGTYRPWKFTRKLDKLGVIDEEEVDYGYDVDVDDHNERVNKYLIGVLGFVSLFAVFCLIVWGASRPYTPRITVKSLTVNTFYFGQGSDYTGVPTKFLTVNCSVTMIVHNPATFFGIHVSSTPFDLFYSEITVASGQMKKFYQPRKSQQIVSVNLEGNMVPLYGAGASFAVSDKNGRVPLRLESDIRSQGDVMGKLVRTNHHRHISCSMVVDSGINKVVKFESSCRYA
ncbi:late embryogenesis abundant protein, group 2 [Actinidia rufa]|uniref:Late embryogenesis abundant protein, group 2 n=1 Tax=Actinidia rufa TaxID=165716 RepID=A0A7J0FCL5_9ERIC|nr:late embryogenesis abundant protein, group 2 [Actinidia rufa]